MSGFESWMLTYLLNSLWQAPLVALAAWAAAQALRRAGAGAVHRVWVGAVLLASSLPALSTLPWERVPDWFGAWLGWAGRGTGSVTVATGPGVATGGLHAAFDLLGAAAIVYGGVTVWFAARFVWRCLRLATIRRNSVALPLGAERARQWERCARRFGIGGVELAVSAEIFGPVTLGLRRKVVLLPGGMTEGVEDREMETVLAHEFAHIRRGDFVKNLLYEAVALPVSYHPALWLVRRRLTESREMVCDAMAAEAAGRREYARSLLRLATALTGGLGAGTPVPVPHAMGIFDTSTLERRLMRLTEKGNEIRGLRRWAVVGACAALGVATCGSALALRMHVSGPAAADHQGPSQGTHPIAVRSDIMAGQRINGPTPKYPEEAKKRKIQGTVVLDAVIGKDGTVKELTVQSGPKELRQSSLDGVRQWTYKPFLLNGEPVEVKTTISVVYSLRK